MSEQMKQALVPLFWVGVLISVMAMEVVIGALIDGWEAWRAKRPSAPPTQPTALAHGDPITAAVADPEEEKSNG